MVVYISIYSPPNSHFFMGIPLFSMVLFYTALLNNIYLHLLCIHLTRLHISRQLKCVDLSILLLQLFFLVYFNIHNSYNVDATQFLAFFLFLYCSLSLIKLCLLLRSHLMVGFQTETHHEIPLPTIRVNYPCIAIHYFLHHINLKL